MDLSRLHAAPSVRLSHTSFEGDAPHGCDGQERPSESLGSHGLR